MLCRQPMTPEARAFRTCLCTRAPQSLFKGPLRACPHGPTWTLEASLGSSLSCISSWPSELCSSRCLRLTPEGPSDGMKWRKLGAQGCSQGESLDRRLGGAGLLPRGWLPSFHQAGLVEKMISPAWKNLRRLLGSGVGEGSPGPDREELGG